MPEPTTTREQNVRRWVELNALSMVMQGGRGSDLAAAGYFTAISVEDEASGLNSTLFDELWPTGEDTQTVEAREAAAASVLLAAQVFDYFAAHGADFANDCREWAINESFRLLPNVVGGGVDA